MNKGWIKLYRKIRDHWLWKEERRFSKLEAWMDLLMSANHCANKSIRGQSIIEIERRQVLTSQIKLAVRWRWNPKTVKRFLLLLKKDEMIRFKTDSGGDSGYTIITILNYDKFQGGWDSVVENEVVNEGLTEGGRITTNKNEKTKKNDKEGKRNPHFSFKKLWDIYPKKVGKKLAEEHFKSSVKTQKDWEDINKALDNYLRSERVKKGFVKDGSTWFKEWRDWVDYIEKHKTQREEADDSMSLEEFEKTEKERRAEASAFFKRRREEKTGKASC